MIPVEERVVSFLLSKRVSIGLSYVHSEVSAGCTLSTAVTLQSYVPVRAVVHEILILWLPRAGVSEAHSLTHCSAHKGLFSAK